MYNILICDDDRDIVAALKIYLSSQPDYQLFEAYTGREALDIVRSQKIQLVLLDIMMPEMDGIAALRPPAGGEQHPHHPPHRQERELRQGPGSEHRGRRLYHQAL